MHEIVFRSTKVSGVTKSTTAHQNQPQYSHASHNVAITVLYTVVIHVVAWIGNQVQFLLTVFGYVNIPSSPLNQILLLATYLTSSVNPVIYVMKYKEFRRALINIVRYRRKPVSGLQSGGSFTRTASGTVSGGQSVDTPKSTTTPF
jgi:hypothetical protein